MNAEVREASKDAEAVLTRLLDALRAARASRDRQRLRLVEGGRKGG